MLSDSNRLLVAKINHFLPNFSKSPRESIYEHDCCSVSAEDKNATNQESYTLSSVVRLDLLAQCSSPRSNGRSSHKSESDRLNNAKIAQLDGRSAFKTHNLITDSGSVDQFDAGEEKLSINGCSKDHLDRTLTNMQTVQNIYNANHTTNILKPKLDILKPVKPRESFKNPQSPCQRSSDVLVCYTSDSVDQSLSPLKLSARKAQIGRPPRQVNISIRRSTGSSSCTVQKLITTLRRSQGKTAERIDNRSVTEKKI